LADILHNVVAEVPGKTKVAIVDDERSIRELLELGLAREGYAVRTAADGPQALSLVADWNPDVIVLDVMMPKIDGFALLPMLRRRTQVPIIMLTARGDIADRVAGLRGGADDYLAKPFDLEELLARLEAALRRPQLADPKVLAYADLVADLDTREVFRAGIRIDLTAREFDLLVTLLRAPRRVFSKDRLIDLVWGVGFDGPIGIVETYISYLRAKIDADVPVKLIQTIRGAGYTLRLEQQ
jgi:DNA-binding response OmpR family regulator